MKSMKDWIDEGQPLINPGKSPMVEAVAHPIFPVPNGENSVKDEQKGVPSLR